jgi:Aldo/keto reductases, related to diketogulonate reductase
MPKLGFGVFQIPREETEKAVTEALHAGYQHIDTAQSYMNELEVGSAIKKSGVKREDIFLTTKLWISHYGYDNAKRSVYKSLEKLQTDYLDLMLLHQPFGDYYGAYRALVELYKEGVLRAVGVSNFYPDRLADISLFAEMAPHVNQVEVNPFNQQWEAQDVMKEYDVQMEAWAPFAEGKNNLFHNEVLQRIGNKYNRSVGQVVLRWLTQRDIVVLAKSVKRERMIENLNSMDFTLEAEDAEAIKRLNMNRSMFFSHQDPAMVAQFHRWITERGL